MQTNQDQSKRQKRREMRDRDGSCLRGRERLAQLGLHFGFIL